MHVQNLMNSLWDIRIFLGLEPKESPCIMKFHYCKSLNSFSTFRRVIIYHSSRWNKYAPMKRSKLFTSRHDVISQKTRTFSNTVLRTSDILCKTLLAKSSSIYFSSGLMNNEMHNSYNQFFISQFFVCSTCFEQI